MENIQKNNRHNNGVHAILSRNPKLWYDFEKEEKPSSEYDFYKALTDYGLLLTQKVEEKYGVPCTFDIGYHDQQEAVLFAEIQEIDLKELQELAEKLYRDGGFSE